MIHDSRTSATTRLDRSLPILLPNPDDTPSRRHGIAASTERLHRLHGVGLIRSAWALLLPRPAAAATGADDIDHDARSVAAFGTASVLLQRYYHNASLRDRNVWATAMACTLLAGKLLELGGGTVTLRRVLLVYAHLYRRRLTAVRFGSGEAPPPPFATLAVPAAPGTADDADGLRDALRQPPGISPLGPIYAEWREALLAAEAAVLRALGFLLHWVPAQLPHAHLAAQLPSTGRRSGTSGVAGDSGDTGGTDDPDGAPARLAERAWDYCSDAHHLDLVARVAPRTIAAAAVLLARMDLALDGGGGDSAVDGWVPAATEDAAGVALVCNALLGFRYELDIQDSPVWMANLGFLRSLEADDGSFNDPGSFLWEMEEARLRIERSQGRSLAMGTS